MFIISLNLIFDKNNDFFYRLTCLNYGFGDIFKKTLTLKLMVAFFVISLKQSIKSYKILFAHYTLYKITNLF